MTPAGTSNELDVQNGWEENTNNTHNRAAVGEKNTVSEYCLVLVKFRCCTLGAVLYVRLAKGRPKTRSVYLSAGQEVNGVVFVSKLVWATCSSEKKFSLYLTGSGCSVSVPLRGGGNHDCYGGQELSDQYCTIIISGVICGSLGFDQVVGA